MGFGKNIMLILHRRLMSLHCIEERMQVKEYLVVRYFVFKSAKETWRKFFILYAGSSRI